MHLACGVIVCMRFRTLDRVFLCEDFAPADDLKGNIYQVYHLCISKRHSGSAVAQW